MFTRPFQVPSYISRSVAGSYDNEGVAIFALVFTFYFYVKVSEAGERHRFTSAFNCSQPCSVPPLILLIEIGILLHQAPLFLSPSSRSLCLSHFLQTLNTGSLFYATLNAAAYFYMVMSWGGYTFIINLIPIHVLLCIVTGRFSERLYVAFAPLVSTADAECRCDAGQDIQCITFTVTSEHCSVLRFTGHRPRSN